MATSVNPAADQSISASSGDGVGGSIGGIGVPTVRIIPGVKGRLTRCTMLDYFNAGTAHTITFMAPLGDANPKVTADVAVNGTTISLDSVPHDAAGAVPGAADWIVVRGANGNFYAFHVASYAASVITITATSGYGDANGTGVPATIPIGNQVWFYGAAATADQPRWALAPASVRTNIPGILCTTPKVYQPILVHTDNGTAAALSFLVSGDNPAVT